MRHVVGGFRESTSTKKYAATGKEPTGQEGAAEYAYWVLAQAIEEQFGPGGGTVNEIYYQITGPRFKLSLNDTIELVKAAYRAGYLEVVKGG